MREKFTILLSCLLTICLPVFTQQFYFNPLEEQEKRAEKLELETSK